MRTFTGIEGRAARLDEERFPVKPGMTGGGGLGLAFKVAPEGFIVVDPGVTLGKAGNERTHSCERTRLRSSAREVL